MAAAASSAAAAAAATKEETEQDQLSRGPFSILMRSVKNNTQVLINLRNNHKLLGRVRAFDRHCNMVLEQVKEVWSEVPPGAKKSRAIPKDRVISKMFLRGACGGGRARGARRPRAQRGPRHGQGR
jgi:small nuclear ribonucleoprotein D2